tara:strand:- start:145 stop:639 length:495 start_codon:yes stop_codon:yes gene_type:complete
MKKLIKRILREEIDKSDKHYRILDKISDYVQLPYFKSMEGLTIYDKDDQEYIMEKILGVDITINFSNLDLYDNLPIVIGMFDVEGNILYSEDSRGYWEKYEYDDKGNMIYRESSYGYWYKWEYDDNGKLIYYERSDGHWEKREYDDNGNKIYFENSDGRIIDRR